jgi:hypothetical protein
MSKLTFKFEMVETGDVIKNVRQPAMVVIVEVPDQGPDPLARRSAERQATVNERVRRAMGMGLSVSRVIRPDCACSDPRRGASGCCANCGGEHYAANPRGYAPPSPPPVRPNVPDVPPPDTGADLTSRAEITALLRWGLERAGMPEASVPFQWNNTFTRRMGDARALCRCETPDPGRDGICQNIVGYRRGMRPVKCRQWTGLNDLGLVRFSSPLWPRADVAERRNTVLHELAHVIAFARHGRKVKAHGREWKAIMRELGETPNRCHSVNRDGLRRRRRSRWAA